MWLHLTICDLVEKNSVVSRSGLIDQYQGLDAILEEVNKALKTLIPPVSQQRHWEIAAQNCKSFFRYLIPIFIFYSLCIRTIDFSTTKLRNNFFKVIGYNDAQANLSRTHPESIRAVTHIT